MDNQNRARASYSHYSEDRRQDVLPSISSHLHYNATTTNDPSDARQDSPVSPNYAQTGAITHAAYDPVHDAYDLPRVATNQAGEFQGAYAPEAYHRGDRSAMHTYNTPRRYENTTTLPPIQTHHHSHLPHTQTEMLPFRSSARTHSPSHNLHSFQIPTQVHAGGSSSTAPPHGVTHPTRAEDESASYMSLPPLSIPTQASSSSGEGKGGSKRIVMALVAAAKSVATQHVPRARTACAVAKSADTTRNQSDAGPTRSPARACARASRASRHSKRRPPQARFALRHQQISFRAQRECCRQALEPVDHGLRRSYISMPADEILYRSQLLYLSYAGARF